MKFIRLLKLISVCIVFLSAFTMLHAEGPVAGKNVIVINSYHSGLSWTSTVMQGIKTRFNRCGFDIQLSVEYLDARRFVDPESRNKIDNFIIFKLQDKKPDLVMVVDNAALNFILIHGEILFPEIPVVFCGINNFKPSMVAGYGKITGLAEEPSVAETVNLALKFHPGIEKVFVIGRKTVPADKYNRNAFVSALPDLPRGLQIVFWDDIPNYELRLKIQELGDNSVIILNGLIADERGRQLMFDDSTKWISRHSNVPVYSFWDVYLGYGIVGGKLISGYQQGRIAAEMALRILKGEKAENIPVISGKDANRFMLDYDQLKRFRIPLSEIPEGSIIINRPDTFYSKYKYLVWSVTFIIIFLSGLVLYLIITIVKRRKIEISLQLANLVVENSPAVLFRWKTAEGWPVEYVSNNVSRFGYTAEELINGTIPYSAIVHPDDLERTNEEMHEFSSGGIDEFKQEYRIITKDGNTVWIDDHTKIIRDSAGSIKHYQGMIIDITERKLAEEALRESEDKFRALAEKSIVGIFLVVDGLFKFANARFAEIHGYSLEEIIDYTGTEEWIHPDDRARICRNAERRASGEFDIQYEDFRIVTKQGEIRHVEVFSNHIIYKGRDAFIGTMLDITERKLAENALRESEKKFHDLVEKSMVGVFLIQEERFKYVNARFAEIHGYTVDEVLNSTESFDWIYPDDKQKFMDNADDRASGKYGLQLEDFRIITRQGEVRHVEVLSNDTIFNGKLAFIGTLMDITERKRTEVALLESRQRLSNIIDFLPDATFAVDLNKRIITWNRAIEELTGIKSEDMLGKGDFEYSIVFHGTRSPALVDLAFSSDKDIEGKYKYLIREKNTIVAETVLRLRGKDRVIWCKVAPLFDSNGEVSGAIEILRDITGQKKAEKEQESLKEKLFQSQKMETVGLLAGGIAHDFNNLLSPIMGYSELMLFDMQENDPNRNLIEQINKSANTAKGLIKRLLTFSRKQMLDLKISNVGEIINEFSQILQSTLRENIEIKYIISDTAGSVNADSGQIEQALLNLAVNAQDAMPDGGLLTIEVADTDLEESYTMSHPEINPGPYVMISVSDTGTGMAKEIQDHIFEPFFTTKEIGKGTGLGLSTVYGIVEQHEGSISVYSELNHGTTFRIYLPRVVDDRDVADKRIEQSNELEHGTETVLLVEDSDSVRRMAYRMLKDLGYKVLATEDPERCIEIASKYSGNISLLLTDVIMPKKNGKELYESLRAEHPGLKVLYMSGYAGKIISHHGILDGDINFLQKPFTLKTLSRKLRQAIDS